MDKLEKKIEEKLEKYIGFDIKKILNEDIDLAFIFGGVVRDIIADKEIHGVDILCLYESMRKIESVLIKEGYSEHNSLTVKDIQSLYSEIHVIIEPRTFIKIIDNDIRIIQLIRPGNPKLSVNDYRSKNIGESIRNLHYLLGQVDMSHCAVHYSFNHGLKESYNGAITHCKQHIYDILDTEMNHNRFYIREEKFKKRGWKDIRHIDKKQLDRKNKINIILSDGDIKNYYMPTPGQAIKKKYNDYDKEDDLFGLI